MKVEFLAESGFNKTGGFVEYETTKAGDEIVYERQRHLDVDVRCRDLIVTNSYFSRFLDEGEEDRVQRRISATGDLGPARWGSWRLSMLGSSNTYTSVDVNIREGATGDTRFSVGGISAPDTDDIDLDIDEGFYIEIVVAPDRFNELLNLLSENDCYLSLRVSFGKFPNFVADWSPSIAEARVIKYLDRYRNLENQEAFPSDFFKQSVDDNDFLDLGEKPISIHVGRSIPTASFAHLDDDFADDVAEEEDDDTPAPPATESAQAISNLSTQLSKSASKTRFWLILIAVAVFLVALT